MKFRVKNVPELVEAARKVFLSLEPGREQATILGLYGELGSGKTAFTQALAGVLGVEEKVLSPTFVIEKFYQLPPRLPFQRLIHIDCYRVEDPAEIERLNWQEIISDPGNLVVIEWAERLAPLLPAKHPKLFFRHLNETARELEFKPA